jgi:hypothetical protein
MGEGPISARIPRLVVSTASVFFALAIANSAAADETTPNPKAPLCDKIENATRTAKQKDAAQRAQNSRK